MTTKLSDSYFSLRVRLPCGSLPSEAIFPSHPSSKSDVLFDCRKKETWAQTTERKREDPTISYTLFEERETGRVGGGERPVHGGVPKNKKKEKASPTGAITCACDYNWVQEWRWITKGTWPRSWQQLVIEREREPVEGERERRSLPTRETPNKLLILLHCEMRCCS